MPAAEELKRLKVGACEDSSDNGLLYQDWFFCASAPLGMVNLSGEPFHFAGLENAKERNWLDRQLIKARSILYELHIAPTQRPMKH